MVGSPRPYSRAEESARELNGDFGMTAWMVGTVWFSPLRALTVKARLDPRASAVLTLKILLAKNSIGFVRLQMLRPFSVASGFLCGEILTLLFSVAPCLRGEIYGF
jgi:hypothetical protein